METKIKLDGESTILGQKLKLEGTITIKFEQRSD